MYFNSLIFGCTIFFLYSFSLINWRSSLMLTGPGCHGWHHNTCWRNTIVDHRPSPSDRGNSKVFCWTSHLPAMRNLLGMWKSKADLAGVMMGWWSLGSQGQEGGWKASSQPWTSWEQTAVFKDLLGSVLWDKVLEGREAQERWLKSSITSIKHKSSPFQQTGSQTKYQEAFIGEQVASDKTRTQKGYRRWKHEQLAWEECRHIFQASRGEIRKAKAQMDLNLARDIKDYKKGFCKNMSSKSKVRENMDTLLNEAGDLILHKNWKDWGTEYLLCFSL